MRRGGKSRVVGKCSDNGSIPYGALERDLLKMIGTAALQKTVVLPDQADPIGEQIAKHEMELARLKRTIAKLIIEFGESDDSDDDPVMEQIRELRDNTSL